MEEGEARISKQERPEKVEEGSGRYTAYHIQPREYTRGKWRTPDQGGCFVHLQTSHLHFIRTRMNGDEVDVCLWKFPSDFIF